MHSGRVVAFGLALLAAACAATPGGERRLGAGGYDVVAYHTDNAAVEGSADRSVRWAGREWRFASAEHRRMFELRPGQFAPAYDGHCAWAMSQGRLARGRPQYWAVHEGRLFLNCNAEVHQRWLEDRDRLIEQADREWEKHRDG